MGTILIDLLLYGLAFYLGTAWENFRAWTSRVLPTSVADTGTNHEST